MYMITYVPAVFMTIVTSTYFFVSGQLLGLPAMVGYPLGLCVSAVVWGTFHLWYLKYKKSVRTNDEGEKI